MVEVEEILDNKTLLLKGDETQDDILKALIDDAQSIQCFVED